MRPRKGPQSRTVPIAVRIPPYLRERLDEYAQRYNLSLTDSVILAIQRGFGDQRGITLSRGQRTVNTDGSVTLVAPRRGQQPARPDPCESLPDPWEESEHGR